MDIIIFNFKTIGEVLDEFNLLILEYIRMEAHDLL